VKTRPVASASSAGALPASTGVTAEPGVLTVEKDPVRYAALAAEATRLRAAPTPNAMSLFIYHSFEDLGPKYAYPFGLQIKARGVPEE
jgi:hypothetical protein